MAPGNSLRAPEPVVLPAAVIGVLTFAVYAVGASPSIYVGDSGELVAAAYLVGIPHPTGYPLYVLLGKLWTVLLPAGSIAWRMGLFSAAAASLCCVVLYRVCRDLGLGACASAFAALLLAVSPSFWSQANIQRVYSLGALFVLLATWATLQWSRRREGRLLYLAFFVCGLGASNHTFMLVFAAALAVFVAFTDPRAFARPSRVLGSGAALAVGLLPYVLLPLRSRANPRLDWGDPETLQAFLDVVLRRDFWERAWIESPADLVPIGIDYTWSFGQELGWLGAVLAGVGVVVGLRRSGSERSVLLLALLVMLGNVSSLALHGSRSDLFIWHRYYIPSYAMAALLAGVGCHSLTRTWAWPARMLPWVVPMVMMVLGWSRFDRSRYRIAESFAEAVLDSLPPGAHLSATDDNILFTLIYLHLVEGRRPDMNLVMQGVGGAPLPPLRFDPDTEPLFFTHHPNWNLPAIDVAPIGLVFKIVRRGAPPPDPVLPKPLEGENDPRVPKDYLTQNLIGHYHYMLGFTFERRDWPRAREEFEAAAAAAPDNDVLFYNLGLIFRRNGLLAEALSAFERAHAINPRHLASTKRPRAWDRLEELRAEKERLSRIEEGLRREAGRPGPLPGDRERYHRRMADLLERASEPIAARGHRLRVSEIASKRR